MARPIRKVPVFPISSHPSCLLSLSQLISTKVSPSPAPNTQGWLSLSFGLFNRSGFLSLSALKPPALQSLTLYQKVDDDGVKATSVSRCAGVIAGVFSLHSTKQQCTVCVDEPVSIQGHGDG